MSSKATRKIKKQLKYIARRIIQKNIITIHGVTLNIEHQSINKNLRHHFYKGTYEGEELRVLKKVLTSSDRVLEIGAGIGFLSAFCAKLIGDNNVVAYEANPQMIQKIKETYTLNDINPTIHNIILSDKDGEVDFYLEPEFWASSMIKISDQSKLVKVKTKNINSAITTNKTNFLIIDIEGGEKSLIPLIDFSNITKLLIELHPNILGDSDISIIIKDLLNKGFMLDVLKSYKNVFYFYK